jgi:uncharacterized membrane protein YeaQ/YmgE (transglycosylase-associated protein family)
MWNLLVFAAIGLLTGAAARVLYPGRRVFHVLGTMFIGILGAVVGGMISWNWWPIADAEFHTGNLVVSVCGAIFAVVLWAVISYMRSLQGARISSR